jgi:hypothetical protein
MEKLEVDVRMAEAEGEHRHLSAFIEEDVVPKCSFSSEEINQLNLNKPIQLKSI